MITAKKIVKRGYILGVDKKPIEPVPGCEFLQVDIMEKDALKKIKERLEVADVVLSDLAPNITGIREIDQTRSKDLCFRAYEIASAVLRMNGNFLCKLFQGEESKELVDVLHKEFDRVKIYKPQASKKRSKEIYVVALGFNLPD